jgi:hypothetical protein
MEIVRSGLMYQTDDIYSVIDRHLRLWRDQGSRETIRPAGKLPEELIEEATGLALGDWLALGFGLFSYTYIWEPGRSLLMSADFNSRLSEEVKKRFIKRVSCTPSEFASQDGEDLVPWDFLLFEKRPVVRLGNHLLVLDESFLLNRITSGLYWDVHDYLKESLSEQQRQLWTQAYGGMVEAQAQAQLQAMAPPILGSGAGGTSYYGESDIAMAFGGQKKCDAAVYLGSDVLLVEIVSGRMTTQKNSWGCYRLQERRRKART